MHLSTYQHGDGEEDNDLFIGIQSHVELNSLRAAISNIGLMLLRKNN